MQIIVEKSKFIKSWTLAERCAGGSGSMNIISTVRIKAGEDKVELMATDIRTSVICRAEGVTVVEPGDAVIPLKGASDLFKKAGSAEFTLTVTPEGKAEMKAGKSRYRFTTYMSGDFPKLPSSDAAVLFCALKPAALVSLIDRGTLCATTNDEYPQYLSAGLFEFSSGSLSVVSTDKRRLAIARCAADEAGEETQEKLLLPKKGLRDLMQILPVLDQSSPVKVMYDDSQAYFITDEAEFAVRRVESNFPPYAGILPKNLTTNVTVARDDITASLERVDVVVRDYNKAVQVIFEPGGESTMTGRAPEFGDAVESLPCSVEGAGVRLGFNTKFFMESVRMIGGPSIQLQFNDGDGHMVVSAPGGADDFMCLIAPVDLPEEDSGAEEEDDTGE